MTTAIITSIISVVFGGLSAFTGMYSIFKGPKTFKDIGTGIQTFKFPKPPDVYSKYYEFLDFSTSILPFIYDKVKRRFVYTLFYIFISGVGIGFDFDKGNIKHTPSFIEIWDIFIYLTYLIIYIIFRTGFIINKSERTFIKNHSFMYDKFLKQNINPKIEEYNGIINRMYRRKLNTDKSN